MARSLMRDLSTFYEPILNQKEQKRWVQLYVKKIFKERLPDNIEKDPAADMMIWFDLTPQALEVRVRDILKGEDVAEVEQPVRSSKPAHLRRVVADAAKKTTRRIMSSYDPAFGDTYYLRVKVPPITGFSIGPTLIGASLRKRALHQQLVTEWNLTVLLWSWVEVLRSPKRR